MEFFLFFFFKVQNKSTQKNTKALYWPKVSKSTEQKKKTFLSRWGRQQISSSRDEEDCEWYQSVNIWCNNQKVKNILVISFKRTRIKTDFREILTHPHSSHDINNGLKIGLHQTIGNCGWLINKCWGIRKVRGNFNLIIILAELSCCTRIKM